MRLGDELQPGLDVVSVTDSGTLEELPDTFAADLADTIYCSDFRPWKTGDQLIDRNLGRATINSLNPTRLEKYLGFYIELLQHATRINRNVSPSCEDTPHPISNLIDHIYREFYHILEAVARTRSSDLINIARGEIFQLSLAQHRQGESHLFDKSISLYASYYHVLADNRNADLERIHSLLTSLGNIQTMLTADLNRARSVDEVDRVVADLDSFYDVLERILQGAIEKEDARTFNNVWNLGEDEFVLVRPESDIFDLEWQLKEADDEAEKERLERELTVKRRQQEAVETFQSRFEETQFVAAAWAYRAVRDSDLAESIFQEIFSDSIKKYRFTTLVEIYFRLTANAHLDLFRWESDDADVFRGVQVSQPAVHTWLREFFCGMGLLFLDADGYDVAELDKSENPLADIEIDRVNYPDLEDTIDAVSSEDLAVTGVAEAEIADLEEKKAVFLALHHQMEALLERREENRVIEADLDPEKVTSFKEDYASSFIDQFVLRSVFNNLGWLDIQSYDEDRDVPAAGFNLFYPKRGFIPDPPAQFIHNLDRQVWSHIDTLRNAWLGDEQNHLPEEQVETYDTIPGMITKVCQEFEEAGGRPRAVLTNGFRVKDVLTNYDAFDSEFQSAENVIGSFTYEGVMLPVYRVPGSRFEAAVLAETDQPPSLTEYQRDDSPVFVKVEKVTRDLLQELDAERYDDLTNEELRDRLQQVWFRALYYAEFTAPEDFGLKITVVE